ncbi:hypothetical protein [Fictibacillus phosphorivorans]|uniref:hypothetical protein n=1 Tax=Fictibacillus phosphorivorans TaxID=1221500 RepID=UPI001292F626|nr:hypothetical protein [Fictibacillus phosphorivorans]MQR97337.1 hypothetical protein [Fictibacillus phosphorivorans]
MYSVYVEKNPFFLNFLVGLKSYEEIRNGVEGGNYSEWACIFRMALVFFVWRSYFSYGARIFRMALVFFVWRSYFSYGARPTSLTAVGRAFQGTYKVPNTINQHM